MAKANNQTPDNGGMSLEEYFRAMFEEGAELRPAVMDKDGRVHYANLEELPEEVQLALAVDAAFNNAIQDPSFLYILGTVGALTFADMGEPHVKDCPTCAKRYICPESPFFVPEE